MLGTKPEKYLGGFGFQKVAIGFGHILKHFYAFITGAVSFRGLNPGTPLNAHDAHYVS